MKRSLVLAAVMALSVLSPAMAETFSIDRVTGLNSADLLNPGPSVQVPFAQLGLTANGDVDALSAGMDAVQAANILFFSVDCQSAGVAGSFNPLDVAGQAALGQQAGDVFATVNQVGIYSVPQGTNYLATNQNNFGLDPLLTPLASNTGTQGNLDALSFEEFDLNGGGADLAVYFSVDALTSLSIAAGPADILVKPVGGPLAIFASAGLMGLGVGDDLDALALLDLNGNGVADAGVDAALFSLAPGSAYLVNNGYSAADIFYTDFSGSGSSTVKYTAASLGLQFGDNVDALEVQIPEPVSLSMLALGGLAVVIRRRR